MRVFADLEKNLPLSGQIYCRRAVDRVDAGTGHRDRSTPRRDREDISDRSARSESIDSKLANDPTEKTDSAEPTEPTDRTDPTEPMDNTEPFEPMHRIESCDRIDHRDEDSDDMSLFCRTALVTEALAASMSRAPRSRSGGMTAQWLPAGAAT
jgi:hypothetical protein